MLNKEKNNRQTFRGKYRISSARLKGYDYSQNGAYYVTICTKEKECFFGEIPGMRGVETPDRASLQDVAIDTMQDKDRNSPSLAVDTTLSQAPLRDVAIDIMQDEDKNLHVFATNKTLDRASLRDDVMSTVQGEMTREKMIQNGVPRENPMNYSEIGNIARACWEEIPKHFPFVVLDEWVVMPNHVHGILFINKPQSVETPNLDQSVETPKLDQFVETPKLGVSTKTLHNPHHHPEWKPGSLGVIINQYKRACTVAIRNLGHNTFSWQPRFHDHISRAPPYS